MDSISPDRRSANMSRIRSKHTVPELLVRRALHAAGLRYRLTAPSILRVSREQVVIHSDHVLVSVTHCAPMRQSC
jgi:DNA mismatch endonuclease, patch repair protein